MWNRYGHARARSRKSFDERIAAECIGALAHADQAERQVAADFLVRDAAAVVAQFGMNQGAALFDADPDMRRAGVPGDVRQRFLHDAVQRRRAIGVDLEVVGLERYGRRDAGALRERAELLFDGGAEAEIVQDRGPELRRHTAYRGDGLVDEAEHRFDSLQRADRTRGAQL